MAHLMSTDGVGSILLMRKSSLDEQLYFLFSCLLIPIMELKSVLMWFPPCIG